MSGADRIGVVIVGGSLAGLSAAEQLRSRGFEGPITIVGDEVHQPYDRPPLSKDVLAGPGADAQIPLRKAEDFAALDATWLLGRRAVALDVEAHRLTLDGGEPLPYGSLVLATGATPRRLPGTEGMAGVHTLRTLDDCLALRSELDAGPRVAVVGAGFIGAEVAATCRTRGLAVTIIEAAPVALALPLGEEMGAAVSGLHGDNGAELRCGVGVAGLEGGERVGRVRLADGTAVDADVVVVGIGVAPNVGWLEGSGLELANGIVCDAACRAAPDVVAAGDVARWPNELFGGELMRVEHWDNAIFQGRAAVDSIVDGDGAAPYAPVPWFWSDQYSHKLQFAGRSAGFDRVQVVDGTVEDRKFVAIYGRAGRLIGVLGMGKARAVMKYRALIEAGATWDATLANPPV